MPESGERLCARCGAEHPATVSCMAAWHSRERERATRWAVLPYAAVRERASIMHARRDDLVSAEDA